MEQKNFEEPSFELIRLSNDYQMLGDPEIEIPGNPDVSVVPDPFG